MKKFFLISFMFITFFLLGAPSAGHSHTLVTTVHGRQFIQSFEGLRLKAYKCPAGVWTIGFGNTSHAKPGLVITRETADVYLMQDLRRFEKHVNGNSRRELYWYEFDALISFTYNCGYRFTGDLRTAVNSQQTERVKTQLMKYVHAKTKVLPGLVRRRAAECKYYEGNYAR